jgi:hypothetical protein
MLEITQAERKYMPKTKRLTQIQEKAEQLGAENGLDNPMELGQTHVRIMSPVEYPMLLRWKHIAYKPTPEGEGFIEWGGLGGEYEYICVDARTCMSDFLELAEAEHISIVNFAKKWGPLGVEATVEKDARGFPTYVYREATIIYRLYAREAQAILRLGAQLQAAKGAIPEITAESADDWWSLWPYNVVPPQGSQDIRFLRLNIGDAVTRWLNLSGVYPRFLWYETLVPYCMLCPPEPDAARQWDAEEGHRHLDKVAGRDPENPYQKTGVSLLPHSRHRPSSLLAVLAMYLIAALASPNLKLCSRCQKEPIDPKRNKKVNYCPDCRKIAHAEDSQRNRRKSKATPAAATSNAQT